MVPLTASKMIYKPMVRLAQTMHLSCTDTNNVPKQKEARFHITHVTRSSFGCVQNDFRAYGTFDANRAPTLRQDLQYVLKDRNELPLEPGHLLVATSASKMISDPMVRLARTMHLSCTDTNTDSKRKEARFHMTHVIYEFHRVHPK